MREAIDDEVGHDLKKLAERARKAGEEYRRARGGTPAPTSAGSRAAPQTGA